MVTLPGRSWRALAACRGVSDADAVFFPASRNGYARARKVCTTCPVVAQCREWQLHFEAETPYQFRYGMFGALTPAERFRTSQDRAGRSRRR